MHVPYSQQISVVDELQREETPKQCCVRHLLICQTASTWCCACKHCKHCKHVLHLYSPVFTCIHLLPVNCLWTCCRCSICAVLLEFLKRSVEGDVDKTEGQQNVCGTKNTPRLVFSRGSCVLTAIKPLLFVSNFLFGRRIIRIALHFFY